jgi:hypothetical protein
MAFFFGLEDRYKDLCCSGVFEQQVVERTQDEIPNWHELCEKIRDAKQKEGTMNDRIKVLWLPGFAALILSLIPLTGAFRAGMFPHGFLMTSQVSVLVYLPWLLALPLVGALGAYWSRRMGGSLAERVKVCLFPVIALIGMFFLLIPVNLRLLLEAPALRLPYLLGCFLYWAVIPVAALAVGALPFLVSSNRSSRQRDVAVE